MKKNRLRQAARLWWEGIILFIIRLVQLRTTFDPVTGLALPSEINILLWAALLICFAGSAFLCLFRPKGGKRSYACCFHAPEGPAMGGLAAGSFLLLAGGALLFCQALPPRGMVPVTTAAAGLFGIAGGAGLLILAICLRSGAGGRHLHQPQKPPLILALSTQSGAPSVLPLLPAMFFSVLFVLAAYFPEEADPVLTRYAIPVLGAAMAAYFFYQLSGFFRSEGSLRWFELIANFAAITCIASTADCLHDPGRLMVYLGFAVTATVFLLLLREEVLPEPEGETASG